MNSCSMFVFHLVVFRNIEVFPPRIKLKSVAGQVMRGELANYNHFLLDDWGLWWSSTGDAWCQLWGLGLDHLDQGGDHPLVMTVTPPGVTLDVQNL